MSSSFDDTIAGSVQPSGVHDSPIFVSDEAQVFDYASSTPVNVSGGGLSPNHPELSSFYSEEESDTPFRGDYAAPDGSVLPPPSEMLPVEGFALREWRRQNALRIEQKEKMEKELLNEIIDEAEEYKTNFHLKRKTVCDNNIAINRESEKIYLAGRDKFHEEADKNYWKAIADLIPKEVPVIETRGAKKDQDKKPSVVVIQGPKPGKPTDLSRMRQILIKLKHNTPLHLNLSPPPPAKDVKAAAGVAPPAEAVAVA